MTAILSALLNFLTNSFNATRIILYGLFVLVLPVVLWNVWVEITEFMLSLLSSAFQGVDVSSSGFSFSFASLGSLAVWFASNLRLGEAFVAFVSALTIRVTVDVLMRIILR
jgi:hypothetical protein